MWQHWAQKVVRKGHHRIVSFKCIYSVSSQKFLKIKSNFFSLVFWIFRLHFWVASALNCDFCLRQLSNKVHFQGELKVKTFYLHPRNSLFLDTPEQWSVWFNDLFNCSAMWHILAMFCVIWPNEDRTWLFKSTLRLHTIKLLCNFVRSLDKQFCTLMLNKNY